MLTKHTSSFLESPFSTLSTSYRIMAKKPIANNEANKAFCLTLCGVNLGICVQVTNTLDVNHNQLVSWSERKKGHSINFIQSMQNKRRQREKKKKMENPWTRMIEEWGRESRMTNIRKEDEIKWEERKRKMDREKREKKGKITQLKEKWCISNQINTTKKTYKPGPRRGTRGEGGNLTSQTRSAKRPGESSWEPRSAQSPSWSCTWRTSPQWSAPGGTGGFPPSRTTPAPTFERCPPWIGRKVGCFRDWWFL